MAAHDVGVEAVCPLCKRTVLQKSMIPILAEGGPGFGYVCVSCARTMVVPGHLPGADSTADSTAGAPATITADSTAGAAATTTADSTDGARPAGAAEERSG